MEFWVIPTLEVENGMDFKKMMILSQPFPKLWRYGARDQHSKGLKTNSIGIHALSYMNDYITFPERLELYDISSNKNRLIYFKNIDKEDAGQIPKTVVYELPISESNIDKVKLVVKSNKKLPKGHVAEGQYAWFFVSEIFLCFKN